MNKFYVVEPEKGMGFGTKWTYGEVMDPVVYGDSQNCPICGGPVSKLKWLPPHNVKLSSAKPQKWSDFVWGAGFPLLISKRFKEIYHLEGLKGIESFSLVEVVRMGAKKKGEFPVPPPFITCPQFHGVVQIRMIWLRGYGMSIQKKSNVNIAGKEVEYDLRKK